MTIPRPSRVAGILVIYSPAYAEVAIPLFYRMIKRQDPNGTVIVVNNNAGFNPPRYADAVFLRGKNVLHEFGGWQAGIDYLKCLQDQASLKAFVFANDTFCNHRPMGVLEQYAFSKGFSATIRHTGNFAAGHLGPLGFDFLMNDVSLDFFLCTYLFSINRPAMEALQWNIHPPVTEVERWVPGGTDEKNFFADDMDAELKEHLLGWLFGRPRRRQWKKGQPLSASNTETLRAKSLAIMCEKLLTVSLKKSGTDIVNIFDDPVVALIRKIGSALQKASRRLISSTAAG